MKLIKNKKYKYKYIVFDFDGTLFDTSEGIIYCLMYTLNKKNITKENRVNKSLIGSPLAKIFKNIFSHKSDSFINECINIFRNEYKTKGILMVKPIKGMQDLLDIFRKEELHLEIVSNKPKLFITRILKRFEILNYFERIEATNINNKNSSKSLLLQNIIKKLNIKSDNVIMIGDRSDDIIAAKANNVFSVGVTYGYGSKQELISSGADLIINQPKDLMNVLLI